MGKIFHSILELVGDTPIVKLNHLTSPEAADLYAKLEFFNPGSSVKDRIALSMINAAEEAGLLKAGGTIVEPTSGNTGIGLAMVAAAKGYHAILVMPDTMSIERRKLMQAYGAELVLTPGADGMKGAIAKAEELAQQAGYFMPMQFDNPANPLAHQDHTGPEIIAAFGNEQLDAFVAGVGTGGTLTGTGKVLKENYPGIKIYAVEPASSPVLAGGKAGPHKIQGIGAGFVPKVLDTKLYDGVLEVSNEDAFTTARAVANREGFLVGISAGAAIKGAIDIAEKLGKGKKVLTLVPDNGERYLSTALYQF